MRLRNVKNKGELLKSSSYLIDDPNAYLNKWHEIFNNNNPIYIEIGMGKGKFIEENALNNPNINYIGIEKFDTVLALAVKSIKKDIPNLRLIRIDAIKIDEVFNKEIDKIYLNFSDPWPKKRHSRRRLTSKDFLMKYENIFRNNKTIELKTDNQGLFEYSLESLSDFGYTLYDISLDLHNSEANNIITTEYEDRFIKKGNPIYKLNAKK
ncbi:MAG: tRNA (guanosine(46)-N7)-methyltransferase TrmB [Bacilli bacterium]